MIRETAKGVGERYTETAKGVGERYRETAKGVGERYTETAKEVGERYTETAKEVGERYMYLVFCNIEKEVGPVWVSLHETKLKQLFQTETHHVSGNLHSITKIQTGWIIHVTTTPPSTSFLVSCGRCVQWSSGIPWTSSAVRILLVLNSGMMAGTANLSSPANSSLAVCA